MKNANEHDSSMERIQIDESVHAEMKELLDHAEKISYKLIRLHNAVPDHEFNIEKKATEKLLNIISQKWNIEILYILFMKRTRRYNELKNGLHGISSRTLSNKLKILVKNGYVERKIFDEYPLRIEYALSKKGDTIARLMLPLTFYLLFFQNTNDRK